MGKLFMAGAAFAALIAVQSAPAYAEMVNVGFTGDHNIQANLVSTGPSGNFITSNGFSTPFSIPSTGNNFATVTAADPLSITGLAINDPTNVFTIMNAYAPADGATIGAVTFDFSDGSSESDPLVAGSNIRDYYQGSFANTLTAGNAENAFTYSNVQGGAATGNSSTGLTGTYVFDEQDFALGSFATGKTLTGIEVSSVGGTGISNGSGDGTPILLGVTVEGTPAVVSAAPEPSTWALMFAGVALIGAMLRFGRRPAASLAA